MTKLPVRQVANQRTRLRRDLRRRGRGGTTPILAAMDGRGQDGAHEDVGLLARVPNPLNTSRTLTICNGIHSRGVYGAVRTLTDTQLRDGNERYISTNFGDAVVRDTDVG